MKAVVESPCVRSSSVPPGLGLRPEALRVAGKHSPAKGDFDSTEMRACFSKLQSLVPCMNKREGKVDKTELLQGVIDYILDLQDVLELGRFCDVDTSSISRQPLVERSDCNIKMTAGDLVALTAVPDFSSLGDFDLRPPSK